MDQVDKDRIKRMKGVPPDITDEEIEENNKIVENLPKTIESQRIGYYIALKTVRKKVFPDNPKPCFPLDNFSYFWLHDCEMLFIEGMDGPCCIWIRSTIERTFIEECLCNENVGIDFKTRIKQPGQNPKLEEMINELRNVKVLDREATGWSKRIIQNGDAIVHHRIDLITQNKTPIEILRMLGVAEEDLDAPGFQDKDEILRQSIRFIEEQRMSLESMEMLYKLIRKRHWHC